MKPPARLHRDPCDRGPREPVPSLLVPSSDPARHLGGSPSMSAPPPLPNDAVGTRTSRERTGQTASAETCLQLTRRHDTWDLSPTGPGPSETSEKGVNPLKCTRRSCRRDVWEMPPTRLLLVSLVSIGTSGRRSGHEWVSAVSTALSVVGASRHPLSLQNRSTPGTLGGGYAPSRWFRRHPSPPVSPESVDTRDTWWRLRPI